MGGEGWYQILRRLSAIQKRSGFYTRRVIPSFPFIKYLLTLNRLALVVLPVYEDPEDQKSSSIDLQNSSPFAWSWLSTINRVNSQVQKVNPCSSLLSVRRILNIIF